VGSCEVNLLKTRQDCSEARLRIKSLPNYNFFLYTNVFFFAPLFCVYGDYQNSKQAEEKPHHKVTKLKSKFYLFLD